MSLSNLKLVICEDDSISHNISWVLHPFSAEKATYAICTAPRDVACPLAGLLVLMNIIALFPYSDACWDIQTFVIAVSLALFRYATAV